RQMGARGQGRVREVLPLQDAPRHVGTGLREVHPRPARHRAAETGQSRPPTPQWRHQPMNTRTLRRPMSLERAIMAFAGVMILLSIALTQFVSPWFWLMTAFIGLNLFQSAFTGFCPAGMVM